MSQPVIVCYRLRFLREGMTVTAIPEMASRASHSTRVLLSPVAGVSGVGRVRPPYTR